MLRYFLTSFVLAHALSQAQSVMINSVTVEDMGTTSTSDDRITISFSTSISSSHNVKIRTYLPFNLSAASVTMELPNTSSSNPRTVSIPRFSSYYEDKIYSAFTVGLEIGNTDNFVFSDPPQFVTKYNLIGRDESPPPVRWTKKGHTSDDILPIDTNGFGSQHTLMNIDYAALVKTGAPPAGLADEYILQEYEGTNFYYSICYLRGDSVRTDGTCKADAANPEGFYDHAINTYANSGTAVYLFLLMSPAHSLDGASDNLIHPKYSTATVNGVKPGGFSAFNTTNLAGTKKFRAATEFLAKHYKGKISGYIVGQELNLHYYWYNRGVLRNSNGAPLDGPSNKAEALDTLLSDYSRTLRMAHTAIRKYSKNARVYTSLTTYWANYWDPTAPPNTWSQFAPSKDFVDVLNAKIKAHGDIDWHLLYKTFARFGIAGGHPLGGPWNDDVDYRGNYWLWENNHTTWKACEGQTQYCPPLPSSGCYSCDFSSAVSSNPRRVATQDYNTSPFITARNLGILPEYFKRQDLLYNGNSRRSIIIGDIGFPACLLKYDGSGNQRCATTAEDPLFYVREDYAAAAVAYQYYKIANLDGIDAWTYYKRIDDGAKFTTGDRLGLGYLDNPPLSTPDNSQYLFNKRKAWDLYVHANRWDWRKYFDKVLYVYSDTQHPQLQDPTYARQDLTSWKAVLEGHPSSGMHFINNPLVPTILTPLLLE